MRRSPVLIAHKGRSIGPMGPIIPVILARQAAPSPTPVQLRGWRFNNRYRELEIDPSHHSPRAPSGLAIPRSVARRRASPDETGSGRRGPTNPRAGTATLDPNPTGQVLVGQVPGPVDRVHLLLSPPSGLLHLLGRESPQPNQRRPTRATAGPAADRPPGALGFDPRSLAARAGPDHSTGAADAVGHGGPATSSPPPAREPDATAGDNPGSAAGRATTEVGEALRPEDKADTGQVGSSESPPSSPSDEQGRPQPRTRSTAVSRETPGAPPDHPPPLLCPNLPTTWTSARSRGKARGPSSGQLRRLASGHPRAQPRRPWTSHGQALYRRHLLTPRPSGVHHLRTLLIEAGPRATTTTYTAILTKGRMSNGEVIAVKKLQPSLPSVQRLFENEVYRLMYLNHPNIVRLRGYCYETQYVCVEHNGTLVFAEISERLLCLQYYPKGSLAGYISDESSGLKWDTRYNIIVGICYALKYLHEENDKPVLHMDLKPANILLDDAMRAKITDFGLARLLDPQQTIITSSRDGTLGYMAPEYLHGGKVTTKSDIFSLGAIILEVITGHKDYTSERFMELTLDRWRSRNPLNKSPGYIPKIRRCIEIGLACVNPERKGRPTTGELIKLLEGRLTLDEIAVSRMEVEPTYFPPDLTAIHEILEKEGYKEDQEIASEWAYIFIILHAAAVFPNVDRTNGRHVDEKKKG
ncbi:hypothetical protein ZWY2020_027167 [Hordeum vulgare]|nr:hypothetical protein ZWY2020_027167 [Hordeum vulgare]